MASVPNAVEILPKNVTDRRQTTDRETDDRRTDDDI